VIRGLGIDVVEVRRIEEAMENPRFVDRILTADERPAVITPPFLAGRWAAKEAVAKAVTLRLRWHDIEILNDSHGKPYVRFAAPDHHDPTMTLAPALVEAGYRVASQIHISISHERGIASAVAIWEEDA
jgi:holo-[acyl-carrier protein] synthase